MERKNKIIITFFTLAIITLAISLNTPLNKQTISTRFIVGENMGFDLGPGNINFGQIIPGTGASRNLTITNTFNTPILTSIEASGEISDYMIVSDNNFILQPEESKTIAFRVSIPEGLELREYPGEVIIITNKA